MATPAHVVKQTHWRSRVTKEIRLNDLEKRLLNEYQKDFPLSPRPFAEFAECLGTSESLVIKILARLQELVQMPPFKEVLSQTEINALVELIYTPLKVMPRWRMQEIRASQIFHHPPATLPDKPKFKADIDNLFMVVELGDHHATLLNGDSFEPIHRLPNRFALHGGPKWADGGRYIYFASRDGWISKFDVFNLTYVAEVRAGINTRNLAVSHDGRYVIAAN